MVINKRFIVLKRSSTSTTRLEQRIEQFSFCSDGRIAIGHYQTHTCQNAAPHVTWLHVNFSSELYGSEGLVYDALQGSRVRVSRAPVAASGQRACHARDTTDRRLEGEDKVVSAYPTVLHWRHSPRLALCHLVQYSALSRSIDPYCCSRVLLTSHSLASPIYKGLATRATSSSVSTAPFSPPSSFSSIVSLEHAVTALVPRLVRRLVSSCSCPLV